MVLRSFITLMVAAAILAAQSKPAAESRPDAESKHAPAEAQAAGDPAVYAPLFRFCPEKVETVMLVSAAGLPEHMKDLATVTGDFHGDATLKAVRAVQAGRKYTPQGDSESVRVYELEQPIVLADVLIEDRYTYQTIAGTPCFVHKTDDGNDWGPLEDWITLVDKKYLVFATRRAILKEALAKRGPTPEACVERLGWKAADVSWGAPVVIVRKPEPDKTKPSPIERLLFAYETATKAGRLEVVGRGAEAVLKHARGSVGDRRAESRPAGEDGQQWAGFGAVDLVSSNGDRHVLSLTLGNEEYTWAWLHLIRVVHAGPAPF